MTRTKSSIAIFILLIFYILFSINKINTNTTEINKLCDEIHNSILSSHWEKAHSESENLLELWEKTSKSMFIYVHTSELDIISCEIIKLVDYTQYKNESESMLCISVIKHLINEINSLEDLTLHNIF